MDFDRLREKWHDASCAINPGGEHGSGASFDSTKKTSLERLATRYRRFSCIGWIGAAMTFLWGLRGVSGGDFPLSPWLLLCAEAYFLAAALMDRWLCRRVREIDCLSMTVESVLRQTLLCRRRHFQFMAVLFPVALGLIVAGAVSFGSDPGVVWGMVSGALFGLAVGLKNLFDFLSDYRSITSA